MTEPGINSFPIYVTNISGSPVTGLVAGGFSVLGYIGTSAVTFDSLTEKSSGFYVANVSIPNAGQGFLRIYSSNPAYYVSPEFYPLEVDNYDSDAVYAKLNAIGVANLPQGAPARFSSVNLTVKQDSSITETIQIPSRYLPLTGISGMEMKLYPAEKLTVASTPALSGTTSATVVSASGGLVSIVAANDCLQGLIPEGSSIVNIYGDIRYIDSNGYERRPVELNISIRRDF